MPTTGIMHLIMSIMITARPAFFPNSLPTLVPPEFLDPSVRGSLLKNSFPIITPVGMLPKM